MSESILDSTKKAVGIHATDTSFDSDIIMHINSVFSTLNQLGIGPLVGFMITDAAALWTSFMDDLRLNNVKTYMYLRVRLLFDPPATSYLIDSLEKQAKELEWRINEHRETTAWIDPTPIVVPEEDIFDGGGV